MKKHERVALLKAIDLLLDVPLPHIGHGVRTASVAGAMRYASDMDEARRLFRRVREAVLYGDPAPEIDEHLTAFCEWFEARHREDWR